MQRPPTYSDRALVTFPRGMIKQLRIEASKKGLALAAYLRSLITTHPERGDVPRAG